ncbi:MAG TPA: cupin domain-containing protein, partial [Thermoanaerobaculia bacterium]|nr:cupin domain-containing protein [Thermoanaerobaculia bacterium]
MRIRTLGAGRDYGATSTPRSFGDVTVVACTYAAGAHTPRHLHERPYFGLVLAGAFTEAYASRRIGVAAGDVAFHPAGESHATSVQRALRIVRVELGARFTSEELAPLLDRRADVLEPPAAAAAWRLFDEVRQPDALSPLVVEALALELAAHALRSSRDRHVPRWLARIRERLRHEFAMPFSLAEIARDAGVHPGHVARVFRQH